MAGRGWVFDCVPYLRSGKTEVGPDFPPIDPSRIHRHFIPEGETFRFEGPGRARTGMSRDRIPIPFNPDISSLDRSQRSESPLAASACIDDARTAQPASASLPAAT